MYNNKKNKKSHKKKEICTEKVKVAGEIRHVRTSKSLYNLKNCYNGRKRQMCKVK